MLQSVSSEAPVVQILTLDGWDNASRTHLLGVMTVPRKGVAHVRTVDTTAVDFVESAWTEDTLVKQFELLGGAEKVAAIVLDSPNTNKSALKSFEKKHPTVTGLYCVCHVLSLFLKDAFLKIEAIASTWERVHKTCKKFR